MTEYSFLVQLVLLYAQAILDSMMNFYCCFSWDLLLQASSYERLIKSLKSDICQGSVSWFCQNKNPEYRPLKHNTVLLCL